MTIIEITKEKIIKAIEKEPTTRLKAGGWIDSPSWDYNKSVGGSKRDKNCSVCAVGAVMRGACLSPNQSFHEIDTAASAATSGRSVAAASEIKANLKSGQYMAALSCKFESEMEAERNGVYFSGAEADERKIVAKVKKSVIEFVKKNFPKKVRIDIDGAKPAKDVKIISISDDNG